MTTTKNARRAAGWLLAALLGTGCAMTKNPVISPVPSKPAGKGAGTPVTPGPVTPAAGYLKTAPGATQGAAVTPVSATSAGPLKPAAVATKGGVVPAALTTPAPPIPAAPITTVQSQAAPAEPPPITVPPPGAAPALPEGKPAYLPDPVMPPPAMTSMPPGATMTSTPSPVISSTAPPSFGSTPTTPSTPTTIAPGAATVPQSELSGRPIWREQPGTSLSAATAPANYGAPPSTAPPLAKGFTSNPQAPERPAPPPVPTNNFGTSPISGMPAMQQPPMPRGLTP